MNSNVVDGIIASMLFGVLSTGIGVILQFLGLNTQLSSGVAVLAFLLLFVYGRSWYPKYKRRVKARAIAEVLSSAEIEDISLKNQVVTQRLEEVLTSQTTDDLAFRHQIVTRLLENMLSSTTASDIALKNQIVVRRLEDVLSSNSIDDEAFKHQIVSRVLRDHPLIVSSQNIPIREYENQVACEAEICEAFRTARRTRILTIRGEKYFSTSRSLLYELYSSKKGKDSTVQMLVLSPQSDHISEELARKLGHPSEERTRRRMRMALDYLKHLAELNTNFEVRCYNETPYLKILLFDDVMFVSSFTEGGGPKNDHNAKMWQMTREGNPLFIGLERHFDKLWERSISPK